MLNNFRELKCSCILFNVLKIIHIKKLSRLWTIAKFFYLRNFIDLQYNMRYNKNVSSFLSFFIINFFLLSFALHTLSFLPPSLFLSLPPSLPSSLPPWPCSGKTVRLQSRGSEEVKIVGIDRFGYLRVRTASREELKLGPNDNSFDLMKGLIIMK